jgi:hypothetical protein
MQNAGVLLILIHMMICSAHGFVRRPWPLGSLPLPSQEPVVAGSAGSAEIADASPDALPVPLALQAPVVAGSAGSAQIVGSPDALPLPLPSQAPVVAGSLASESSSDSFSADDSDDEDEHDDVPLERGAAVGAGIDLEALGSASVLSANYDI